MDYYFTLETQDEFSMLRGNQEKKFVSCRSIENVLKHNRVSVALLSQKEERKGNKRCSSFLCLHHLEQLNIHPLSFLGPQAPLKLSLKEIALIKLLRLVEICL
jgi:hypothetical protein